MPDFEDIVRERWSCRAFRPDPVPDEVLERVLRLAQRSASWCNTQPWAVHLLRDGATAWFARELTAHVASLPSSEEASPDLGLPEYAGVHQERRRAAGLALYRSLGIGRSDHARRTAAMLENYSFFGAPVLAVVTVDRAQGDFGLVDTGGFVANLLNAAVDSGLAAIAQGALGVHAGTVRRLLDVPERRAVVCGVALGYAVKDHPVNGFRTDRAALPDMVTVVDVGPD
ncbi:nitroreductase [Nocardioides sp. NPDC092400]|uniref:nitroreductase n=1 Tax=Nocardioides sp. NPDC092400 TaxID=3155196 RepID=UPI00342ADD6B